jgi:ATP-dependent RNA helicase DeaD
LGFGGGGVCVATDVASRGIDLPNLDLVIHADVPKNSEALLHRSGRTGRAGRSGVSVVVTPHSKRRSIERLLTLAGIKAASRHRGCRFPALRLYSSATGNGS